jgi:hypothetical protein
MGLPAPIDPRLSLASEMPLDTVRALARPGGEYWAVWSSWAATGRVFARRSDGSGDPDAQIVVREPAARAGFAAMRQDGSVLVVWEEGSPPHAVKVAGVGSDGEVEAETALDTEVAGVPSSGIYARIAVDSRGRALALWVNQGKTAAGTVEEIRAQRLDGRWAAEHVALGESTVDEWAVISPLGLVLDPHGNGFAGFGHGDPARAWVQRFRETSGWQAPVKLSESATAPLLAVDAAGRAAVAWASGGKVYLRRFIELTAPRPRH